MNKSHNVFISHRHEDDAHIAGLKDLLKGNNVQIRDSSITGDNLNQATDPSYIKTQLLAPNIKWAGKVIVLITPDTKNHEWVDWEIEYAVKLNKPIIGVWALGSAGCEVPEPLEKYADALVGWNAEKILDALNGAQTFEDSTGKPRKVQPLRRIDC